jgi:hypothetical protein
MNMPKLTAHEIVLFATNTGELYETHKQLAREGASQAKWFDHVTGPVLRLYFKQVERALAFPSERWDAARELKSYYERHIREG